MRNNTDVNYWLIHLIFIYKKKKEKKILFFLVFTTTILKGYFKQHEAVFSHLIHIDVELMPSLP